MLAVRPAAARKNSWALAREQPNARWTSFALTQGCMPWGRVRAAVALLLRSGLTTATSGAVLLSPPLKRVSRTVATTSANSWSSGRTSPSRTPRRTDERTASSSLPDFAAGRAAAIGSTMSSVGSAGARSSEGPLTAHLLHGHEHRLGLLHLVGRLPTRRHGPRHACAARDDVRCDDAVLSEPTYDTFRSA